MQIVFLDQSTVTLDDDMDFSGLRSLGKLVCYPNSTRAEAVERARDARTVIVNKVPIDREVIGSLPALEHVAVIATGYNNIDLAAASGAGIRVTNVRGYAEKTVSQHTFALILNLATRAHQYDRDIRAGRWQESPSFTLLTYPTFELSGKTLGIIGYGTIGRAVAKIARAFGMRVMVHDVAQPDDKGIKNNSLEEVLCCADIISLHCPLTDENRRLINRETLGLMKPGAILINTARGGLVDEDALAEALNSGRIAGAGLDTLAEEPPGDSPLLGEVRNLILTPHSAWSAREARQRLIDEVAENIRAFLEGRERNVVTG
ncbi:MAG: D-2-hydroxyacid dehydrogenase [Candidatus Glassbacteria bacterium]|nr:D-2-hydroxyacid dehydrogenase [Candidatus Glassbacteria bacterium]